MSVTTSAPRGGTRVHVQKFGTFLSNMIMPNIGAIIAWGLLTALFIPDGWTPNEKIATLVGPSIFYLLPILIAYTGGKIVLRRARRRRRGRRRHGRDPGDQRSRHSSAAEGNAAPMFLGAMIMGPLTALAMKKVDALWEGKIRPGFEMLVNNFSAGILAAAMAIVGMFPLGPVLRQVTEWLGSAVEWLVDNNLLPLSSILIEPAKVLFLNNAINHGVLTPLGIQQAAEQGNSILFLLEANPGPGGGLLLAYCFFGRGHREGLGARCAHHPVPRRHPRDLLPLRAGQAEADPRHDPRRHDRHRRQHAVRHGPAGACRPGVVPRGVRHRRPGTCTSASSCRSFAAGTVSFLVAAFLLKLRPVRRRARPRVRHRGDGGA